MNCPTSSSVPALLRYLPLALTVLGWTVSSYLSSLNSSRQAKRSELNKLIESVYECLDEIYDEMLQLVTKENSDHEKNLSYHKFISQVSKVTFICKSIRKMNKKQKSVDTLIAELRQASTDDKLYSPTKIGVALPKIRDIQERFRVSFEKIF